MHEIYITAEGAAAARRFDKQVKGIERMIEDRMGREDNRRLKELLARFEGVFSE